MKRKSDYLQAALSSGALTIDAMRAYKKRKGSKSVAKSYGKRKMSYRKQNKGRSITTTQLDVNTKKPRKYNKAVLRKKQAFANKIQKALQPKQELNVYSEIFTSNGRASAALIATNIKTQILSDNNMMMNAGKLFSLSQNTGYIMGRYQNILGSTNATVTQGAKSQIPSNEFKLQVTSSNLDLTVTNPSTNTQPTIYDIYEFVAARDIADVNYSNPLTAWERFTTVENYIPLDATSRGPVKEDNGQTPYDCPQLGRYWKVLKRTRLYLTPNSTSEYQMNCGKFTLNGDRFNNNFAIAGITKAIVVISGIGDNTDWPVSTVVSRTLVQKTWHFKYQHGESELPQRPTNLLRSI